MSSINPIGSSPSASASVYQEMLRQISINKAAAEAKKDAPSAAQAEKASPQIDADNDGD